MRVMGRVLAGVAVWCVCSVAMAQTQAPASAVGRGATAGGAVTTRVAGRGEVMQAGAMDGVGHREVTWDEIVHPKMGEWPSYNGVMGGNRYSGLRQINRTNVARMGAKWMFRLPGTHRAMEATPLVVDGMMYVTAANECFALNARTGKQVWHYARPRTADIDSAADAATGINRGAAVLGQRLFMVTDNARLIALDRMTGKLLWDVEMADYHQNYTATGAPLVVEDMVVAGISGGDEGVRGFLAAYRPETGERVWRVWTVPAAGEPGAETWVGKAIAHPGSSTWMTGTYDPVAKILYWGVGNPGPDHNGDERKGDNLYSCSVLALEPKTGKLIWYRQFTPHNLHDWDSTQTPMLVDAVWHGRPRKLLVEANRNGFFYVLDRLTGEYLLGSAFIHDMNWASGLDKNGRPILMPNIEPTAEGVKVCPNTSGATNWPAAAFDPQTGQFLVFASEMCAIFIKREQEFVLGKGYTGGTTRRPPGETGQKFLRAIDVQTGKIAWEIAGIGGSIEASGLMATAGGFVFYGDGFGALHAADVRGGKQLWSFNTNESIRGGPMAYVVDGKERLAIVAGQTVLVFGVE